MTVSVIAPADLFEPAPGWTGGVPVTEGQFAAAAATERAGRQRANEQLGALCTIYMPDGTCRTGDTQR